MKHILLWLTLATQASVSVDTATTGRRLGPYFVEHNPVSRQFTGLPRPAYAASAEIGAAGVSFLAWKMKHSPHKWVRRVWWVPQTLTIAGATQGAVYTAHH